MSEQQGSQIIEDWPEQSREAAQLVIDSYGEPHESTPSVLTWYDVGPWKRLMASKVYHDHEFPIPHIDSVVSYVDYRVPVDKATPLMQFDGSVIIERTAGEVGARCHDEQANLLALNLMHDIVTDEKSVDEARRYYAHEFLNYRRKEPTPYMDGLRVPSGGDTADRDQRILSDDDLEQAAREGEAKGD
jgi:hypothetical protein